MAISTNKKLITVFGVIYEERDITARVIIAYVTIIAATVITGVLIIISLSGTVLALFFLLLFAGIHAGTLYMLLVRKKLTIKG